MLSQGMWMGGTVPAHGEHSPAPGEEGLPQVNTQQGGFARCLEVELGRVPLRERRTLVFGSVDFPVGSLGWPRLFPAIWPQFLRL